MIKVFVSQPMNGVEPELIEHNFIRIEERLSEILGDTVKVLDTYNHEKAPKSAGRIWHLGESIKLLDKADLVIFMNGYEKAKGCAVERKTCTTYKIPYYHESFIFDNKYLSDFDIKCKIMKALKEYKSSRE